ncbi:hypothetical protein JM93_01019 [Roseibium hamelinense]|uniref:Uncharacterized protein n=1 Tax=Roseibium hamelinense TaxID=150831 RepID=A0A562T9T2_9HYPH|nr:hypothetical protein [Roseibium hamelinense]MTI45580.1 hypothetical protein [Roseibium hamelinense]TWI90043.1 hypothetical protein JM93_01019 [Roseibium hamelinense]
MNRHLNWRQVLRGLVPAALITVAAAGFAAADASAQTNQLRGLNQGNASSNLPSAEQQLQSNQNRLQSDFSTSRQIDSAERRQNIDTINRLAPLEATGACANAQDCAEE